MIQVASVLNIEIWAEFSRLRLVFRVEVKAIHMYKVLDLLQKIRISPLIDIAVAPFLVVDLMEIGKEVDAGIESEYSDERSKGS